MNGETKVVSFYSFKGGAGRTLCAVNLAGALAKELSLRPQNRMLLMDMDTDSAGLTILMKQLANYASTYSSARLIHNGEPDLAITDDCAAFFDKGLADVSSAVGASPGAVGFLGTEPTEGDETVPSRDSETRMRYLISDCGRNGISAVLIDSASGRQENAHLCHMVSNVIVYCCRLTNQFLVGTENHLRSFINLCKQKRDEDDQPYVILVPVAVPHITDGTPEIWKSRKQYALGSLAGLCALSDRIQVAREIGEVQAFKWIESVLSKNSQLAPDEARAMSAYSELASNIGKILKANN